MRDYYDAPLTWEEQREIIEKAILNQERLTYGLRNQFNITPYESNDLGDKVYKHSGELLTAFINDDKDAVMQIMCKICFKELDSLHDLIYG